ncbi:MICAL-like protein 2 [Nymphon striatum]|nr:MICAL-like protein 2 [Nymphon striatum]
MAAKSQEQKKSGKSGNPALIIRNTSIVMGGEKKGTKALELWCRQLTNGYKDVNVANMTTAFRDGLAFCALIHHFRPDLLDFESLSKENIFYNNKLAFNIAEEQLGIPALLDPEDMVQYKVPDKLSIMTYVAQFYNFFEDAQIKIVKINLTEFNLFILLMLLLSEYNKGTPAKSAMKRTFKEQQGDRILVGPPDKIFGGSKHVKSSIGLGRRQELCETCKNRVYILERLIIENKLYHRTCFKCVKCKTLLKPGSYVEGDEFNTYECVMCPHEERAGFDFSFKSSKVDEEQYSNLQTDILKETLKTDNLKVNSSATKTLSNSLNAPEKVETEETDNSFESLDNKHDDLKADNLKIESSSFFGESSQSETSRKSSIDSDTISRKNISYEMEADNILEALESSENESSSDDSDEDENEICSLDEEKCEKELEVQAVDIEKNTQNENALPVSGPEINNFQSGQISDESISVSTESELLKDDKKKSLEKPPIPKKPIFKTIPQSDDLTSDENTETANAIVVENASLLETENEVTLSEVIKIDQSPPKVSSASTTEIISNESSEKDNPQIFISQYTTHLKISDENEQISQSQIISEHPKDKDNDSEIITPEKNENRSDVKEKIVQPSELPVSLESPEKETIKSLNPFESDEEEETQQESQSESYPDTKNPFGDSEDEEDTYLTPVKTEKMSTNPFGDSDDDDQENNKPDDSNPFGDDDDDESNTDTQADDSWIQSVFGTNTLKPTTQQFSSKPVPKPRSRTLSNSPIKSGSGTLSRKKKRAPLPPGVNSTPEISPKPSPRLKKSIQAPSPPPRTNRTNSDLKTPPSKLSTPKIVNKTCNQSETKDYKCSHESSIPNTPTKLEFGYWKKKKKAPPIPVTVKRQISNIPIKELQQELAAIDEKQSELELAGVEIEKRIRDMSEEEASKEEEDLIMQLFDLVNKKNALFRRQSDLMYLKRQNRLEEEHTELEYQFRLLMQRPAHLKTDFDKGKEEELLTRLLEVVELRNDIIESQERDRLRITAEEKGLEEEMSAQKKSDEIVEVKKKSKKKSKEKKKKKSKEEKEEKKSKKSKKLIKLKLP